MITRPCCRERKMRGVRGFGASDHVRSWMLTVIPRYITSKFRWRNPRFDSLTWHFFSLSKLHNCSMNRLAESKIKNDGVATWPCRGKWKMRESGVLALAWQNRYKWLRKMNTVNTVERQPVVGTREVHAPRFWFVLHLFNSPFAASIYCHAQSVSYYHEFWQWVPNL